MCTVLFIPGKNQYFFAALRDESPLRPKAIAPEIYTVEDSKYLCPKDPLAGGSWIGVTGLGCTIILLNGGFENHQRKNNYGRSRGLIVTELLVSTMPVVDWNLMDMEDIEPFTLIVWADENLFQLVWDGAGKHRIRLDAGVPHLWSSSTLYDPGARAYRNELFQNWLAKDPAISKLSVLNFLKTGTDEENGFIINRKEQTKTLSYSFVELDPQNAALMHYYDFTSNSYSSKLINLFNDTGSCMLPKEIFKSSGKP